MNQKTPLQEDEIDLIALLKTIYKRRKLIFKTSLLAAIIGLIIGILSPSVYNARTTFVLQTSSPKLSSSLGGLASLAGIDLSSGNSGSEIPPSLYPKIISNIPFKESLLKTPLKTAGENLIYKDYLLNKTPGVGATLKKYTLGLPGVILSAFKKSESALAEPNKDYYTLSDEVYALHKSLEEIVQLETNEKEGYISLSVQDADPEISAQLTLAATALLQNSIIEYKIENAKALYEFTKNQYDLKKIEFNHLQDSLAFFKEQNINMRSAYMENNLSRLQASYNLVNTVYTELAKQLEQAKIQLSKDTPIFTVIEPVSVPKEKSAPKRALILLIYTFLGLVVSIGWVLIKAPFFEIKKEIMND